MAYNQQNFLQQLQTAQIGYLSAGDLYPSGHAAPLPQNGYTRGVNNTDTNPTGAAAALQTLINNDPRQILLNASNYPHPWVNDPAGAVWDERSGFWRVWMITAANWGLTVLDNTPQGWSEYVSPDLINWTFNQFPFDEYTNPYGDLWGGSVVIDTDNTAGLGYGQVFYFISQPGNGAYITQMIGRWTAPELGLPPVFEGCVLAPPAGYPRQAGSGFRDSRVFRDTVNSQWILGVTIDYGLAFYTSTDLTNWSLAWVGDWSQWQQIECPNMFRMAAVDGTYKWVVMMSMKGNASGHAINPADQAVGYLIGEWDGKTFTPDPNYQNIRPRIINVGPDYYAQAPFWKSETEVYIWAWIGNWQYSGDVPTRSFINTQSMVCSLYMTDRGDGLGYRLFTKILDAQQYLYPTKVSTYGAGITGKQNPSTNQFVKWGWQTEVDFTSFAGNTQVVRSDGITTDNLMILPNSWRARFVLRSLNNVVGPYADGGLEPLPNQLSFKFCKSFDGTKYAELVINMLEGTWTFTRKPMQSQMLAEGSGFTFAQTMWDATYSGTIPHSGEIELNIIFDAVCVEIMMNDDVYISAMAYPNGDAAMMTVENEGTGSFLMSRCDIFY